MILIKKIDIPYLIKGTPVTVSIEFVKPIKVSTLPTVNIQFESGEKFVYNIVNAKDGVLSLKGIIKKDAPGISDRNKKV